MDCKITVQFKRVLMPVTELSPADAKALDEILKNYDKSLYKIVTFENGVKKTGSENGTLEDKYICEKAAIVDAARLSKASGVAIQVAGLGCNPACSKANIVENNDKLVAEVESLLEKYCPQKK
jgi:hypothetical protein